jgi:hypothetical protein
MIHLQPMEIRDATDLMLKDAGIDTGTAASSLLSQAEELVKCVGRLPLAVVHAASYMKQTRTSFQRMLELYKDEREMDVSQ